MENLLFKSAAAEGNKRLGAENMVLRFAFCSFFFFRRSKAGYCVQLESHKGLKRVTRVPMLQKHIFSDY